MHVQIRSPVHALKNFPYRPKIASAGTPIARLLLNSEGRARHASIRMASWRFYQGLRAEWRWYRLNESGDVIAESDQGFAELQGCMENAETAGFNGGAFQVYARQPHELQGSEAPPPITAPPVAAASVETSEVVDPAPPPDEAH